MLKFRYDADNSWQAVDVEDTPSTMNAVLHLDLPEEQFALKVSAAVVYNNSTAMSPTNFDRFHRLID